MTAGYQRLYRQTYGERDYTQAVLGLVDDARRRWELPAVTAPKHLRAPRREGQMQLALIA